mmetsp:Transcript_89787/g.187637  ORF Transcript_89787/g.187637 Transcript_89787/m.187637 type:complete len:296 (+) Transcript_89787:188-1075(+)|eukprot:CAMPEP_0206448682 /NCGR_PEP_ID=MMETSP0324_2-20121206/17621_1 /ASSEMBLY_ACC=CAM_ASM_000836 /TAXON_ID=2866 /ORGANISM="Crypthecodinium cohnii, Strain Seligo" /LENGTH=295 /DNA_ID=CAMNT_0053917879 /DNA_START=162 /DNA_END=1049 /DNA_ORIENTATION=-
MSLQEVAIAVPSASEAADDSVKGLFKWVQGNADLLSGAVGGPLVVGTLTPQRNGMTLAAKDVSSSFFGIYKQVFSAGFFAGWRGGSIPVIAAVPQFTAIGPVYLMCEQQIGSPTVSMFGASVVESTFTFSAQRRNAQIQYNATVPAAQRVPQHSVYRLLGAGYVPHVFRNMFAQMGIRLFSPHSYEVVSTLPGIRSLNERSKLFASDLASSVVAATLSMPFNHMFSWASCTPELDKMSYWRRATAMSGWLINNYREQGMRLLGRDLLIRINYTAYLFTGYRFVERLMVDFSQGSL